MVEGIRNTVFQNSVLNILYFYEYKVYILNMTQVWGKIDWKAVFASSEHKRAIVSIFIPTKTNFKTKNITKVEWDIYSDNNQFVRKDVNAHVVNYITFKSMKQEATELKRK